MIFSVSSMRVNISTDDFTVDDDIQLDPRQVDEIFARSLNKGAKNYLDRLERIASYEGDLDSDEISNLAVGFEGMRKFIAQKKNGFQSIKVADFQDFGISSSFISKIRYLVHRLDTASPRQSTNRLSHNSRRASLMTTSSVQDDCDDDYGDDFEDDEDDRVSFGSHRNSLKRESRCAKEVDDDVMDIIDEEEEEDDERSIAAVAPAPAPVLSFRKTPESPSKYNRPNGSGSFSVRPTSGNTDNANPSSLSSNSVTITTTIVNSAGSSATGKRYDSIKPKVDSKYESTGNLKADARSSTKVESLTTSQRSECTSTNSSLSMRASNAGLRRRVKNSTWINEGNWKLGEKIGTGSFGEVFKAMNDKGKLFAVKRLNMVGKPHEVEDLTREIELMKDLEHANIVGYIGASVNEESGLVFIFQEWAPGGSVAHLLKHFGPFEVGTVRNYTRQILRGLCYLHDNGIIHRDIKGGNVLVDTGTVKLADFGASTKMAFGETQSTSTIKGTPYFMAPETLSQSKYGRKGDIWAVGCTIIQMLTGEPPWKEKNLNGLVQLHMLLASWNGPPDYDREVPIELKECLEMCFAKEADKRPTAVDLLDCPFLSGDELDESANIAEQLGFAEPSSDKLNDSGMVLMQQISRAVSRASLCIEKPGGASSFSAGGALRAHGAGGGGGWKHHQPAQEDDSTMGGIDRQIMMREKMRAKQREDKEADRADRYQPHYQLNMPARGTGGYSPFGYDAGGRDEATRLSPKDIAELVSQSSCQSANNPFAKGASPFSANKRTGASFSDPNSRNSPNPMTPARVIRPLQTSVLLSGGSGKGYSASKQKPVHAFSEINYGSSAGEDTDRDRDRDKEREREKEKERERERDSGNSSGGGGGSGVGGSYRSRPAFNDKSPCPARNPFQSIVEEGKSSVASTSSSRSLPSSPVFFPCSPSILSSPVGGSHRVGDFDKDERCRNSGDSLGLAGASTSASGPLYKRSGALSVSGSNYMDITNGELAALKRKTLNNSSSSIGHANSGSDVGSGLDCDGDYEGDDRRDTRLRQPYIEKRHFNDVPHSTGRIRDAHAVHTNISRSFSTAGEDFDGEEPELDIIRSTPGSSKGHHHHHLQQLQQLTIQQDRTRATSSSGSGSGSGSSNSNNNNNSSNNNSSSSSSASKPTLLKSTIDQLLASASSKRLVHSASNSRIRPSSSADLNPSFSARRKSTAASKSPSRRIQAPGQPQSASVSCREDEENEGYGYGQRYDNSASASSSQRTLTSSASASSILPIRSLSHRSSGRAQNVPLQTSTERNSARGRSKDPVYRPTGSGSGSGSISSISKKDFVRIGPNQLDTGEDEEAEWRCMKCSNKNTNQYHCDSCATKRTAYSYAPGQQLQLQPQPAIRAPPK